MRGREGDKEKKVKERIKRRGRGDKERGVKERIKK